MRDCRGRFLIEVVYIVGVPLTLFAIVFLLLQPIPLPQIQLQQMSVIDSCFFYCHVIVAPTIIKEKPVVDL